MTMLDHALDYLREGLPVIPIGPDKKALVKWEQFQTRLPSEDEVRAFWTRFPNAWIGIITGKLSGISVVDFDTYKRDALRPPECLETIETPTAESPQGGKHFYFEYDERIPQGSGIAGENSGVDGRNDGGYIIAPPSRNGKGAYKWVIPFSRNFLVAPPDGLISFIKNAFKYKEAQHDPAPDSNIWQQSATLATLSWNEGKRDESLFHVAHCLLRGGMTPDNALKCLEVLAKNCNPPFPTGEIREKISSALKRLKSKERNLTAEIRDWVSATFGQFSATSLYADATIATSEDKHKARTILGRLVDEGLIERVDGKNGWYIKCENQLEDIDYLNACLDTLPIRMPLGEHELAEIMPGNIILLAGEPNSGKTSWLFNLVKLNMQKFNIRYLNSEMSPEELRKRLLNFKDVKITDWKWKIQTCAGDFHKYITPGKGTINIIDYLEIYSDFWEIGRFINEIHKKLDGAVAVIAIQKNPGTTTGLGGFRTLEKPRLALSLSRGRVDIVKAKNWASSENPNGKYCEFKILQGGHMYATSIWKKEK